MLCACSVAPWLARAVAGLQHDGVEVPVGKQAAARDLATIVDTFSVCNRELDIRWNEIVQIDHWSATH
jgi:hypothetical protein